MSPTTTHDPHPRFRARIVEARDSACTVRALSEAAVRLLTHTPDVRVIDIHAAVVPKLAGNLLHDAHTAILMREHGIQRVCTRDTDFHRFPFLEVVDPPQP